MAARLADTGAAPVDAEMGESRLILPVFIVTAHALRYCSTQDVLGMRLVSRAHAELVACDDAATLLAERYLAWPTASLNPLKGGYAPQVLTKTLALSPFRRFVALAHNVPLPMPPPDDPRAVSRYNDNYYCGVLGVVFHVGAEIQPKAAAGALSISFDVRGDMSLGALQGPMASKLGFGGTPSTAAARALTVSDKRNIVGTLWYRDVVQEQRAPDSWVVSPSGPSLRFTYGYGGYGAATPLEEGWPGYASLRCAAPLPSPVGK